MDNKIVRVDIVDNDYQKAEDRVLQTYYLLNPDEEKLNELADIIKNRLDDDAAYAIISDLSDIEKYISDNFQTVEIRGVNIEW